jgi:zinc/manganese transport system substrate-binding protein
MVRVLTSVIALALVQEVHVPPALPIRRRLRPLAVAAAALTIAATAVACSDDDAAGDGRPTVVVTTTVLGSLVEDLVGDAAEVEVLMPNGVDPHDFQASARDAATLADADLVVENGLDLEEGLEDALDRARDADVPVFTVTDHVELREFGEEAGHSDAEHADEGDDHADEAHAEGGEGDEHGPEDPHVWMDPLAMGDAVAALAPALAEGTGIDVAARADDLQERLRAVDAEVRETLADVPAERRRLVTGHESMGYFADRYDFELVGALIPSLSSQAQVSASNLAALRAQVEAEGVPAIFAEAGTPDGVAEAIADQTGARVVEIGTHALPDDGSYFTFIRDAAAAVDEGLGA